MTQLLVGSPDMTDSMWSCPRCSSKNEMFRSWCRKCSVSRDEALRANQWQAPPPVPAPRAPGTRRSGHPRPLGVVTVLVVLALGGAGAFFVLRPDDSTKIRAAAADPRTQEQIFNDALAAQAVQLTLADFPAEWHTTPRSDSPHDAGDDKILHTFEICMGDAAAAVLSDESETPGTAKTDKFEADRGGPSAEAEVTLRPSIEAVQSEFALLHRPQFPDCFRDLTNASIRHAIENPAPGQEVPAGVTFGDATVTLPDLPDVHADAIDVRSTVVVTGPRGSITEVLDFVFAHKQRTEMTLFLSNIGEPFPTDLAVQLTNAMADRVPDV
jgi:hypothetical protein